MRCLAAVRVPTLFRLFPLFLYSAFPLIPLIPLIPLFRTSGHAEQRPYFGTLFLDDQDHSDFSACIYTMITGSGIPSLVLSGSPLPRYACIFLFHNMYSGSPLPSALPHGSGLSASGGVGLARNPGLIPLALCSLGRAL